MKKTIRIISLCMAMIIAFSCVAAAGSHFAFTDDERAAVAEKWDEIQADDTVITLSVGSEAGSVGFSWLSNIFDGAQKIRIADNEEMKDAKNLSVKTSLTLYAKLSNKAVAEGLETGKVYWYSYTKNGEWSEPAKFVSQSGSEYTAVFTSDAQIGRSGDAYDRDVLINDTCGWQRTVRMAAERFPNTAFFISSGDQTEYGFSLKQYKAFLSPKELRSYPIVKAVGNHDFYFPAYTYFSNNPNQVKEVLDSPAGKGFYFLYGDALYIVINSNNMIAPDQKALFEAAINAYPDAKWRIAVLHHSAYSAYYDEGEFVFERSVFAPLFDTYDIDLALSGHDHMYSCTYPVYSGEINDNGTVYLQASSASGGNIYGANKNLGVIRYAFDEAVATYTALSFKGDNLTIETYRTDTDAQIDSMTLTKSEKQTKTAIEYFVEWFRCFIKTFSAML